MLQVVLNFAIRATSNPWSKSSKRRIQKTTLDQIKTQYSDNYNNTDFGKGASVDLYLDSDCLMGGNNNDNQNIPAIWSIARYKVNMRYNAVKCMAIKNNNTNIPGLSANFSDVLVAGEARANSVNMDDSLCAVIEHLDRMGRIHKKDDEHIIYDISTMFYWHNFLISLGLCYSNKKFGLLSRLYNHVNNLFIQVRALHSMDDWYNCVNLYYSLGLLKFNITNGASITTFELFNSIDMLPMSSFVIAVAEILHSIKLYHSVKLSDMMNTNTHLCGLSIEIKLGDIILCFVVATDMGGEIHYNINFMNSEATSSKYIPINKPIASKNISFARAASQWAAA